MNKWLVTATLISSLFSVNVFAGGCPAGSEGKMPFKPVTEKKGEILVHPLANMALGDQAIAAKDWNFRARTITFGPGAIVPLHSHNKRPEMAVMKHGQVTVYETNCTVPYVMHEGDVYNSGKGDSHWVVNEGKDSAVMYVVDLLSKDTFPNK